MNRSSLLLIISEFNFNKIEQALREITFTVQMIRVELNA